MANNRTVLMLARFTPDSTNISQAKGFKRIGWETIEYDFTERLKILGSSSKRDKEIVEVCQTKRPKVVFVSKGAGISVNCIHRIKSISRTVLWYMDPLDDNWNQELKDKIDACHLVCCGLFGVYKEAKKINPLCHFVHEGFDDESDFPHELGQRWEVSLIGQAKGKRAIYQVAIGFKVIGGAYGTDHAIAVARSKINLNFVVNNSGCSDRVYKILAAGGFLLSEDWPGREHDFVDGQDLVIFCGLNDLNRKIHFYLEHENKRMVIAGQGMKSVQRFTRVEFARKIIALAESIEEAK